MVRKILRVDRGLSGGSRVPSAAEQGNGADCGCCARCVRGAGSRCERHGRDQGPAGANVRNGRRWAVQPRRGGVDRGHAARARQGICRVGDHAQSERDDHPCGIAAASADRIGHRHGVARGRRRRYRRQRDDRVVGGAPHVGRWCARRRAAQHAGLQPLPPLVLARREPHDAGRHAARCVRLRRQPHPRRRRRLGAQRSVRQLGLLEPHSDRRGRPRRSRARGDRRSLRCRRARRRHPGPDARRRAAAAARRLRSRVARDVPRVGLWWPPIRQLGRVGRRRSAEYRRRLRRGRRGTGAPWTYAQTATISRGLAPPSMEAGRGARRCAPTSPTKIAATERRRRSTTPSGARSRATSAARSPVASGPRASPAAVRTTFRRSRSSRPIARPNG